MLKRIIWLLLGGFLIGVIGSCGWKKPVKDTDVCMLLFAGWEDSLSGRPVFVCSKVDSILPLVSDSITYYQLLVMKAKAKMFMSEADSAEYFYAWRRAFAVRRLYLPAYGFGNWVLKYGI